MHGNMVQPSARSLETPAPRGGRRIWPQQARNNNGQARLCSARFCGNAANEGGSLLDDLRIDAGSTTYAEREEGSFNGRRINGLQNSAWVMK
jgi:hypothetical protein